MAAFTSLYDPAPDDPVARIESRIRACEQSLGVSVTIHDHVGFFRDAEDRPLLLRRHMHSHRYCQMQRQATYDRCSAHCVDAVHAMMSKRRCAMLSRCWKGVREIVLPLLHDQVHVATLYIGTWRHARQKPQLHGVAGAAAIAEAWQQLPCWQESQAEVLTAQLSVWAAGLVALVAELRFAGDDAGTSSHGIRRLIARHAHTRFRLADLATILHLSPSRTSHLVHEACGMNFQTLLLAERIARAKVLLEASPHSLTEIAERCGFQDMGWFSRVFHREVGMPPGAYRSRGDD